MRKFILLFSLVLPLTASAGCAAYKLKPATGYAKVNSSDWMAHYKASDDTGLNVRVFGNVEGGTLDFWAEDLVEKLRGRGYTLTAHAPLTAKNGVPGLRLDFGYVPPGIDAADEAAVAEATRFYTAALFVSDDYRVVIQLAGKTEGEVRHQARLTDMLATLKIRGCDVLSKICKPDAPTETTLSTDAQVARSQTKTPPPQ